MSEHLTEEKYESLRNALKLVDIALEELRRKHVVSTRRQPARAGASNSVLDRIRELDAKVATLQAAASAAASEQAALLQQISDLRNMVNMATATSSSETPGPGAANTGQPSGHRLDALQQQVDALRQSRLTAVPTKVVLRNVPRKYDTASFLPVLLQCNLQSTDKIQCALLPSRKADAPGNNFVLEFPADMRTDILAAASQLQLLEGIVMVPYLTPYGAALRRQRQPIYKELLDKGLRPSWRGGANLRYTDSSGNSVMYDFEAGPAA
jgi:hypothetical protein